MAHIWIRSDAREWQPVALATDACALTVAGLSSADTALDAPAVGVDAVWLRRVTVSSDETWALLASPSARPLVNGLPAPHGLVVLSDCDEIRLPAPHDSSGAAADPIFFSTERLATVTPYPAGSHRGSCPRCKLPLTAGDAAVRCPGCGLWHHATAALPCWTYGEQCAACQQPTSPDAGFLWTPENL